MYLYADISLVLTYDEALELFKKDPPSWTEPWTGIDECGEPETEIEWAYDNMGCGRTSWGVGWDEISPRACKLLTKFKEMYFKGRDKVYIVFCAEKEVYPPIFLLKLLP